MAARNYSNIAVATTLSSGITAGATSLIVADATGWPAAPFLLVIDPDTANEELILVGSKTGTTFGSLTRGFGGTSGVAHNAGATIKHVTTAEDHSLVWSHVHTGSGGDDTAQVTHGNLLGIGANDHHNQVHDIQGADHSASGLTSGHVLKASGATTFSFAQLLHSDLGSVGTDDHHPKLHQADHQSGGADALSGNLDAIARVTVRKAGVAIGSRRAINLLEGTGITLTVNDDATNEEVEVTITANQDHGTLTGLGDDDHTQYHTDGRALTWLGTRALGDIGDVTITTIGTGEILKWDGTKWINNTLAEAGISATSHGHDHGTLTGLGDDDHSQYLLANGSRQMSGHLDPSSDNALDLGDATLTWRNLYVYGIFDEAGTQRMDSNAWLRMPDGSAAAPAYAFSGATNYGMFYATNYLRWAVAGVEKMTLGVDLNISVPVFISSTTRFSSTTSWGYDPPVDSSGPTMRLDNTSPHIVEIGSGFSSVEYKEDVQPVDIEKSLFSRVDGVWFNYKSDAKIRNLFSEKGWEWELRPGRGRMGVLVEQLEKVEPKWVIEWRGEKMVNWEGLQPDWFGDYLAIRKEVLRLRAKVTALEAAA